MKYLTILVLSMTALLIVACSSGGSEPTVAPEATETQPALATVVLTDTPDPASYPANEPTAEPMTDSIEPYPSEETPTEITEPYPDQNSESTSDVVTDDAYPAEVDLSDVTSEPSDGQPQEAPRPGVPDDSTAVIHQVSQDLAARLGVDISVITAVEVDAVEWSDSSLGCPSPDYAYAQVITPGYYITLEADGQDYNYRTDLNGNFVLCGEDGQPIE